MAVPSSVYDYDVRTRELTLLRADAGARRLRPRRLRGAPALGDRRRRRAGARSRSSRRRGRAGADRVPVLLYGYGAYEASMDPYFSIARLSLLDRGAAFAIAHVRGGGEMGRRWYDDGKLLAQAEHLLRLRRLRPAPRRRPAGPPRPARRRGRQRRRAADGRGRQPGPGAFAGVVAQVPFVDALTTMLDATLPLTVTEYDEWGNPEADPEVYDYMAGYAPYDNVARGRLPADPGRDLAQRHPGAVRRARQVGRPAAGHRHRARDFLLKTEMAAGHGGRLGPLQGLARPGVLPRLDPRPDGSRRCS